MVYEFLVHGGKILTFTHSDCGYDHSMALTKIRRNAVDFTGCLAHVEVSHTADSTKVLRIRGYFEHNQGCRDAGLSREPIRALHPSVLSTALDQLRGGATLDAIQMRNRELYMVRGYPGQPYDLTDSPYRWVLKATDSRSLYRQHNRIIGVNVTAPDYLNVNAWLDPASPEYKVELADAIFHYKARAAKDERFEMCIATHEMKEATWQYAHKSQVVLDGTFGVCDKKMLLFILMGIDEKRKGVPLAFLLFSAPGGNRKTCAGYNTEIIAKLLQEWKNSLGSRNREPFDVLVAITDTDLMERGALVLVFPKIWLLICKFHLRQSWRNHRNKVLKGKTPTHVLLKKKLKSLEDALVVTVTIADA